MTKIIMFFLALNGRELTDQHGNKLTVTVADGHNVVSFEGKTASFVNADCTFKVKDGDLLITRRTGKTFITVDKTGIWLPSIQ